MMLQSSSDDGADPSSGVHPTLRWGAVTHVGGVREHNEDAFFVSENVCVVADGMGGHEAGEVASQLVTGMVADAFDARRLDVTELPGLVTNLNDAVRMTGDQNDTRGMGTTLVGVARAGNGDTESAVVFHVGDSRCYRLVDGAMDQLTTDHSHVQELLDEGRINPDDVRTHPLRNVITRALGAEATVRADFHVLPDIDCRLLLCSDGLTGELDHPQIDELLRGFEDPSDAARALLEAAISGTANDNVTVIVADVRFAGSDDEDSSHRGTAGAESDGSDEITVDVDASADPTAEVEVVVGRPSAPPDGAAWDPTNPT